MVAGCCVCCCDCTRIPSNEHDKEPFEEVAEHRARVKRSETNERRKFANLSCRIRLGEAQYKREPQHSAPKEADVERAGSKTVGRSASKSRYKTESALHCWYRIFFNEYDKEP